MVRGAFYRSRPGRISDPQRVQTSRELEQERMAKMHTVDVAPEHESVGTCVQSLVCRREVRRGVVQHRQEQHGGDGVSCVGWDSQTHCREHPTMRLVISFAISAGDDMRIGRADVTVALSRATMGMEMYLRPPAGSASLGFVWRLVRALHGTRRATRLCAGYLAKFLVRAGWRRSQLASGVCWREELSADCSMHGKKTSFTSRLGIRIR